MSGAPLAHEWRSLPLSAKGFSSVSKPSESTLETDQRHFTSAIGPLLRLLAVPKAASNSITSFRHASFKSRYRKCLGARLSGIPNHSSPRHFRSTLATFGLSEVLVVRTGEGSFATLFSNQTRGVSTTNKSPRASYNATISLRAAPDRKNRFRPMRVHVGSAHGWARKRHQAWHARLGRNMQHTSQRGPPTIG